MIFSQDAIDLTFKDQSTVNYEINNNLVKTSERGLYIIGNNGSESYGKIRGNTFNADINGIEIEARDGFAYMEAEVTKNSLLGCNGASSGDTRAASCYVLIKAAKQGSICVSIDDNLSDSTEDSFLLLNESMNLNSKINLKSFNKNTYDVDPTFQNISQNPTCD